MQLPQSKSDFDIKKVEEILLRENKFITNLFAIAAIPERHDDNDDENVSNENGKKPKFNVQGKKTSRAKSLLELQQRLEAITSKKKLSYKEKLTKKGLKNRMKKKSKRDERNAEQKLKRAQNLIKTENGVEETENKSVKPAKPVFNSEGKMVFSKFDFSDIGHKKDKKQEKDPKKLLKNLEKQKETLKKLEESGEKERAEEIKEKTAWKNALAKAEGQKVKDDPTLLKKTVQRQEQKQRSSKKKWEARIEGVKRAKEEKQKKRTENIEQRKKGKKISKLKKAAKKGKIIPGF